MKKPTFLITNDNILLFSMKLKLLIITSVLLIINACGPSRGHIMLTNYLDNGIGTFTYEDIEERWHSADELIEGEETFTGIWIREDYIDATIVRRPLSSPNVFREKKTLVFDNKTRLLKSYKVEDY